MASKMEVVIQRALKVFRQPYRKLPDSTEELAELQSLANEVTMKDIKIRKDLKDKFLRKQSSSLEYIQIFEDDSISVGVFLLRQGAKLPIHDHPGMYGIIKVLEGVFKVTSYSVVDVDKRIVIDQCFFYNHPVKTIKHPEALLSKLDQCCMLTPTDKNIHEVECIEGPGAFLDILSPPYEDGGPEIPRSCHYFKELPMEGLESAESVPYVTLSQILE